MDERSREEEFIHYRELGLKLVDFIRQENPGKQLSQTDAWDEIVSAFVTYCDICSAIEAEVDSASGVSGFRIF